MLEKINEFKLVKTGVTTYQHVGFVGNIATDSNIIEYRKTSTLNNANLRKKGNFYEWSFWIFRSDETDIDWDNVVTGLKNFNGLADITFTLDIDDSGTTLQVYFWSNHDPVNDYDVEKIYCKVVRVYSDGNEP